MTDAIRAGLHLLLRAAAEAGTRTGIPVQISLNQSHRTGQRKNGQEVVGFCLVGKFVQAKQSQVASNAIFNIFTAEPHTRDVLLDALGPTGEAAATDGLAWTWHRESGFHLLRRHATVSDDPVEDWIRRNGPRLAHGAWPVRESDCASAHHRLLRQNAGAWNDAEQTLADSWSWNPLLDRRPVLQFRRGKAALWYAPGFQEEGPPLVLAAAAW